MLYQELVADVKIYTFLDEGTTELEPAPKYYFKKLFLLKIFLLFIIITNYYYHFYNTVP